MELKIYDNGKLGIGQGELTAAKVTNQIDASNDEKLTVRVNSGGGSVFDGWAIYNSLISKKHHVTTVNDGIAGSISAIILQAGNKRKMYRNSLLMIHLPSATVTGTADEMEANAAPLRLIQNEITQMLSTRTGLAYDVVAEMLAKETWLNADMALQLGFIDEIIEEKPKANYQNMINETAPVQIRQFVNSIYNNQNNPDMEATELKNKIEENTSILNKIATFLNIGKKKPGPEGEETEETETTEGEATNETGLTPQNAVEFANKIVELTMANEKKDALLTEVSNQLTVSNTSLIEAEKQIAKTREEVATEIKSEFDPKNQSRTITGVQGEAAKFQPTNESVSNIVKNTLKPKE